MPHKSYRKESRSDWGRTLPEGENIETEGIKLGAILRIADSLEKIEQPYLQLLNDVEWTRDRNKLLRAANDRLHKQVAAYKGIIKRMKKKKLNGTEK